jgi:hypothetical protein
VSIRRIAVAAFLGLLVGSGGAAAYLVASAPPAPPEPAAPLVVNASFTPVAPLYDRESSRLGGVIRADDGAPIGGALACAYPAFAAPKLCVATGPDGRFEMTVPTGYHKLQAVAPPATHYVTEWYEDFDRPRGARLLDLRSKDIQDLALTLTRGRKVSGRLLAGGAPVADAQACAGSTGTPTDWVCGMTDSEGRYSLNVLPELYQMFFVPPEGTRLIPQWWDRGDQVLAADSLDLRSRDVDGINASFVNGHLLHGLVRSEGGVPIEHVLVCVDTPLPTGRICRPTNKEGAYSVAVRTGTFAMQVRAPGASRFVSEWYDGTPDPRSARQVGVRADTRVDITLTRGQLIWGQVRNRAGEPLESAPVNIYDASASCCLVPAASVVTGMTGDYVASVVAPGRYWVEAFPPYGSPYIASFYRGGRPPNAHLIEVTLEEEGDAAFVDFELQEFQAP